MAASIGRRAIGSQFRLQIRDISSGRDGMAPTAADGKFRRF
jgi:hypothetical protein